MTSLSLRHVTRSRLFAKMRIYAMCDKTINRQDKPG